MMTIWYITAVCGAEPERICPVIMLGKKMMPSIKLIVGSSAPYRAPQQRTQERAFATATLAQDEQELALLPAALFQRIHRTYIIARRHIRSYSKQVVSLHTNNCRVLPVERKYAEAFSDWMTL